MLRQILRMVRGPSQLEQEILKLADDVWGVAGNNTRGTVPYRPVYQRDDRLRSWPQALDDSLHRLTEIWPADELGHLAADLYFHPVSWRSRYTPDTVEGELILTVLTGCLVEFPPPDILERLEARLRHIFNQPPNTRELSNRPRGDAFVPPTVEQCLELLLALPPSPQNLDIVERIVTGALDRHFADVDPQSHWNTAYKLHARALGSQSRELLQRMFEHRRLTYDVFCRAARHLPFLLSRGSSRPRGPYSASLLHQRVSPEFSETIWGYCDRFAAELAEDLSEENCRLLTQIDGLRGSRYLVLAAHYHATHRMGKLALRVTGQRDLLTAAVVHLTQAQDLEPTAALERAELVDDLKTRPPETLKRLLPIAVHGRGLLCAALGWDHVRPLADEIVRVARLETAHDFWDRDVRNSPDSTAGVLNVPLVHAVIQQAGESTVRQVVKLYRDAKVGAPNTLRLIEAIAGWNRTWVEQGLSKRNQLSVKAYGLLPLDRDEEEIVERYLFLKQFGRESRQFGPQRQASEQSAVQVALANLAQVAGYRGPTHLELAIEARLGQETSRAAWQWTMDPYKVAITLEDTTPRIVVSKGDKVLKSVPAAVRRHEDYARVKTTADQLKEQVARLRSMLEQFMVTAEPLNRTDLEALIRQPVGSQLASKLIWRNQDDALGLLDTDRGMLQALDDTEREFSQQVYLAHPYDLFQTGQLAAWQQEIVRRRLVQPFKQAFRELYLLTPAEEETHTFSNRFAGQALDPGIAARLFQARGWEIEAGDGVVPMKQAKAHGLTAFFEFPDAEHFLTETDMITSDRIQFMRDPAEAPESSWEERTVPLGDVPPILFSEVMRDADLVVTVAQLSGRLPVSEEAYQRRRELVTTLITDLGLSGVTVDGHFAHVQGTLARYRVHLGSAAIHIEPGNYLCVVPERWGRRHERLFLPFADEGDAKLAEVISKILLLVNDDQIKDQSIVRQIHARRGQ